MRFCRIFGILGILGILLPHQTVAYSEVPPFESTVFSREYGMFRWYQGCWFRVKHAYAYIICSPTGEPVERVPVELVPELIAAGVLPADSSTGELYYIDEHGGIATTRRTGSSFGRLDGGTRLSPARGDGIPLSTYYGVSRFGGSAGQGSEFRFNGSNDVTAGRTGVFRFRGTSGDFSDATFRFSDGSSGDFSDATFRFSNGDNDGVQRIFGEEVGGSSNANTGAFSGNDGFFSSGNGTRMPDIFYEPIFGSCDSIHDSIDGGVFGPIPCTSYPGVFGPVPVYPETWRN